MKVVQIVTQLEGGGAQKVALLLSEGLRARGHDVETWFLYLKRSAYLEHEGVRVLWPKRARAAHYPLIMAKLVRALREHRPDAIITHTHYANVLGQVAAKLCGVRSRIAVQHNPYGTYPQAARWADRVLGNSGVYTANVGVSEAVVASAGEYSPRYRRGMTCIYNGLPLFQEGADAVDARQRWGLPAHAPLVLNVGRLARQKNQAALLDALVHLPDVHLAIAGDGELRAQLVSRARDLGVQQRAHFLGEVTQADVYQLMRSAEVFAFPSLYEAMPMALIEAMRAELPVVASDIPAAREVLRDTGLLVQPDDPAALAAGIRTVLTDPAEAARLRTAAAARSQQFSFHDMVDAYEHLLAS